MADQAGSKRNGDGAGAPRPRRTHAERTAETRARVMKAVVETIADVGFQKTTAAEIARRAGVTWGAVQHHFGGKEGILLAVLEASFERFAERIAGVDRGEASIDERVDQFVDRAWSHFDSDDFRSSFEILRNVTTEATEPDDAGAPDWRSEMFRAWDDVWSEIFGEDALPARRRLMLQRYTMTVLSGLSTMKTIEGPGAQRPSGELALLKETLVRAFADGA